jgi:hypothetical protein
MDVADVFVKFMSRQILFGEGTLKISLQVFSNLLFLFLFSL